MEAYGYVLQFFIWVAWAVFITILAGATYVGTIELYDAIRRGRMSLSHIKAAFFMAADYAIYKVTRAKNAGRHAVKVKKDDVNIVVFWHEVKAEFEASPYSLSRVNNVHVPV